VNSDFGKPQDFKYRMNSENKLEFTSLQSSNIIIEVLTPYDKRWEITPKTAGKVIEINGGFLGVLIYSTKSLQTIRLERSFF
jgi:hypothetical protein